MLKKFSHGKYNQINNVMIGIINNIDLKKFSINEIKQLLYIELSDNKTIYNLAKNTNFFNDLSKNNLQEIILSSEEERDKMINCEYKDKCWFACHLKDNLYD